MTDPIADLLTRIRNASKAKMKKVDIPASNIKREIARILEENHFIGKTIEIKDNRQGILRVYLRYTKTDDPIIRGIQRVSRPGLRRYVDSEKLIRMRNQMGMTVVSTSKGLMTDEEARREGIGGEAVCYVW
jgi:small subunit ribosomal protein S8